VFSVRVDDPTATSFDDAIQARWRAHQDAGHFRFPWQTPRSRVPGGRFNFLLQYNPLRAATRRAPQSMVSVVQPVDPAAFNFTKVQEAKELVCELVFERTDAQAATDGANRDLLLINVSPIEFGHCLLIPSVESILPQVLTERSIALAMQLVLLSGDAGFKAVFNSLCAYASVNHLHWQLYYLRGHRLHLETVPARPIGTTGVFEIRDDQYSAPAFAFELATGSSTEGCAARIFRLITHLQQRDIAHNVFITRGLLFRPQPEPLLPPLVYPVLRIFVWTRETVTGAKDPTAFSTAACELAGQVLLYRHEDFEMLTEDDVVLAHSQACRSLFPLVREHIEGIYTD